MTAPAILATAFLLVLQSEAQQFEVAVIRPTPPTTTAGTSFNLFEGGRIKITNEPVKLLVRVAFQLPNAQIAGGPAWLDSDRYDIEAKTGLPEKPTPAQLGPMIRNLLEERFHLKYHRETRQLTVYALVPAKTGPKLKPAAPTESAGANTHGGPRSSQLVATATTMPLLATYIANRLERVVIDQTNLTGAYDFHLEWAQDPNPESALPSLVTALHDQLGLTLQSQKAAVEVLVIDNLERPTEN
jgi:uncharacterized protein (TIGR03435 family)